MASFITGALTLMLLYFYDAVTDTIIGARRRSEQKREKRVAALYETGVERLLIGNRREAEKFFRKALAHDHEHIPSLVSLGKMLREDGEITEAIKLHSRARGLGQTNIAALLELADDYVASEQFANAVSMLQQVRQIAGKSLPPLTKIRDIYVRVKNLPEAISIQKKIVSIATLKQVEEERRMLVALTYEQSLEFLAEGKFYDARDGFKSVIRSDYLFIPAYLKLAEVYERIGSPKDATKTLEKGFKATHSIVVLKALEMFLLARKETALVVENYKWAKGLLPNEDMIRLFLAEAYMRNSDIVSARQEIESLNGKLGGMTLYHLVKGKIRHVEQNVDLALESLGEAYQSEVSGFFHFTCSSCNHMSQEYSGRCRNCGQWNTFQPVLY